MEQQNKLMVCVRCMTYNHAPYIVDAMNGFTMQQTTFPFVCAIVDDASTDGEQEVIKQYLNDHFNLEDKKLARHEETDDYVLTFARHKTNMNCHFAVLKLKYNHYGTKQLKARKLEYIAEWNEHAKYIAICEGDDYWSHPQKLQIQVDYMESHLDCSLCFHANKNLQPNGDLVDYRPIPCKKVYYPEDIVGVGGNFMATNSMLFRNRYLMEEGKPDFWIHSLVGDLPNMLYHITKGYFGYIDSFMSIYRVMAKGSWSEKTDKATVFLLIKKLKHNMQMYKEYNIYTGGKYRLLIKKRVRNNQRVFLVSIVRALLHLKL